MEKMNYCEEEAATKISVCLFVLHFIMDLALINTILTL